MQIKKLNIVFPTSYFPPIEYFYQLYKYPIGTIDIFENYIKQSYRNRCIIFSANGKLPLSIPVIKTTGNHTKVKDIKIDYQQSWQRMHSRSIESAYNSSPFYLYYKDHLEHFFEKKHKFLIDLNFEILQVLFKLTKIHCEVKFSENYFEPDDKIIDFRKNITPKIKQENSAVFPEYTQVFSDKHGFISNLSILDLLFNEGKFTADYIKKIKPAL